MDTIRIEDDAFVPERACPDDFTEMTWRNGDDHVHTVTSPEAGFDSGDIAPGDEFVLPLGDLDFFSYHCIYHSSVDDDGERVGMTGRIL